MLVALDGEVVVRGPAGRARAHRRRTLFEASSRRRWPPDELLVEVRLPAMPAGAGYAFEEFARRHGDFAIVGLAAWSSRDGARCTTARLASAGAGPGPSPRAAEALLERDGLGEAAIEAAAARAAELVDARRRPARHGGYRRHLAGVLTAPRARRGPVRARA